MKHIYNIGIALAAVLLAAVSCQKVEESASAQTGVETETVTFGFILDAPLTKADGNVSSFGDGKLTTAHELVWQAYVNDEAYASSAPVQTGTAAVSAEGLGKVDINLAIGKEYRILFFLYNTDCAEGAFGLSDLRNISLNYSSHDTSSDAYDVFCAASVVTPGRNKSLSVTLRRPTVQVNIADKVADWATTYGYDKVAISISGVGTSLDAATGKAVEKGNASFASDEIVEYQFGSDSDYQLRSMVYVLPSDEPSDITVEFTKEGATATLVVEDVTLTANTRVNIVADDIIASIPASQKSEKIADGVLLSNGEYFISNAAGMQWFADQVNSKGNGFSGKVLRLTDDIDLSGIDWYPIGQTGGYYAKTHFMGTFDGQGHTISNLSVTHWEAGNDEGKNYATGLFGFIDTGVADIMNLTVDGATVKGHHWCAVIAGFLTGNITDCHVTGSTIECTHANGEACGDKAGSVVGYINSGSVKSCTASSSSIVAGRDAGQIVGAAKESQVIGCSAENVSVTAAGDCTGANIAEDIIGRKL